MFAILTAAAVAAAQPVSPQAQPAAPFDHKAMNHSQMDHSKMDAKKGGCGCCEGKDGAMGCKKPAADKSADSAHSSH